MSVSKIVKTSASRVFLIEGRARGDHAPSYASSLRMTGISQGFGDIEKIEVPDPDNYGKFIEAAQIKGASERVTTTLEGRYALELKSTLMKLAGQGCAFDVQLHIGECTNPSLFNTFKKAIILESAAITTIGTDDLGALQSDDNAGVNETADISATKFYEVLPLTFTQQAGSIITNEIVQVAICDTLSCGECTSQSDGLSKIFGISKKKTASPTDPADVVYTPNKGANWYTTDIDGIAGNDPNGVDCLGDYLVVVSNAASGHLYAPLSSFDGVIDPTFTLVSTGYVAAKMPNAIWSAGSYAFIVGDGGYVYGLSDPTGGVSVLDAGAATLDKLIAVHGLDATFAVAVGQNSQVIYTPNGVNWSAATALPSGLGVTLNTVWVKSKTEWWVGSATGKMWYTLTGGASWTEKTFSGSGSGTVNAIVFATDSVGYMAHATSAPRGRIFRTYDGGYSWNIMPESGTLPLVDRVDSLAVGYDANFVVAGGLADDGADGFIMLGAAS